MSKAGKFFKKVGKDIKETGKVILQTGNSTAPVPPPMGLKKDKDSEPGASGGVIKDAVKKKPDKE